MTRVPRFSALDLSLCSVSLRFDCTWKVNEDSNGSDHLPITISITNGFASRTAIDVSFDLTQNIDWTSCDCQISITIESMEELPPKEEYNFLAGLIIDSAVQAQTKKIPGTTIRGRPPTPWWDQECSNLNAS